MNNAIFIIFVSNVLFVASTKGTEFADVVHNAAIAIYINCIIFGILELKK